MGAFYEDIVGLRAVSREPEHHVWFSLSGLEFAIHAPESEPGPDFTPRPQGTLMWFEASGQLGDVAMRLRERGLRVWGPFDGGARDLLYTLDPDGNMVGLFTTKPDAATSAIAGSVHATPSPFELETRRLRLRDYVPSDLEAVHVFASDPAVVEHLPFGPNDLADTDAFLGRAMASARASPRRTYEVALTDRETHELIGGIRLGIQSDVHRDASLGYILRRDLWGRGLVTEAAAALVNLGFARLGLHRIWATCSVENVASRRVLEKIGMHREAHLRDHLWVKGRWRDSYLYAFLESDRG